MGVWTDGAQPPANNPFFRGDSSSYSPQGGQYGAFYGLGFDSSRNVRSGSVTRGKRKGVKYLIKVL